MFRKLYNRATLDGVIVPDGPLLIVEGGTPLDPTAPNLAFVRTLHEGGFTVYLPGSSLKGVLRAHGERLLATEIGSTAAEDPFDGDAERRSRAKRARENGDRPGVLTASCEADRLFGSTEIAGRLRVADALPRNGAEAPANRTEIRYGVAIDRAKQSVRHGPFDQEAVTRGAFRLRATLENYELWMLALALQVFRDLTDGFVQIGHAKTRGFGTVRIDEPTLQLLWPGQPPQRIEGAGARERDQETRRSYGLVQDDAVAIPESCESVRRGLFSGFRLDGWESVDGLLESLTAGPWTSYVARAGQQEGGDGGV